jgi:hypothetical protein
MFGWMLQPNRKGWKKGQPSRGDAAFRFLCLPAMVGAL